MVDKPIYWYSGDYKPNLGGGAQTKREWVQNSKHNPAVFFANFANEWCQNCYVITFNIAIFWLSISLPATFYYQMVVLNSTHPSLLLKNPLVSWQIGMNPPCVSYNQVSNAMDWSPLPSRPNWRWLKVGVSKNALSWRFKSRTPSLSP